MDDLTCHYCDRTIGYGLDGDDGEESFLVRGNICCRYCHDSFREGRHRLQAKSFNPWGHYDGDVGPESA